MEKTFYTYILASKRKGALYVGITEDLQSCILDHKSNLVPGATSLYAIHQLVYFSRHANAGRAFLEERAIQSLPRIGKLNFVERHNAAWRDLYTEILKAELES